MSVLISVIIPVYKVEKYLEDCVSSVIGQSYRDLEIILVDDGSPDRCGEICDSFAAKDDRVRVIHQANGGLSAARNTGIAAASGEYIMFVDSDDMIASNAVEKLYNRIIKDGSDIAMCNIKYVWEDGEGKSDCMVEKDEIWDEDRYWHEFFSDKRTICVVAWNKIYPRKLLEGLRFREGKIHEDEFMSYMLIPRCKKISCVSDKLYFYLQRKTGIIGGGYNIKRLDSAEAGLLRAQSLFERGIKRWSEVSAANTAINICRVAKEIGIKELKASSRYKEIRGLYIKTYFKLFPSASVKFKLRGGVFVLGLRPAMLYYRNKLKNG